MEEKSDSGVKNKICRKLRNLVLQFQMKIRRYLGSIRNKLEKPINPFFLYLFINTRLNYISITSRLVSQDRPIIYKFQITNYYFMSQIYHL